MEFVNPSPFGEPGVFSVDPVYNIGSNVTIKWTAGTDGLSTTLMLSQINTTDITNAFTGASENITQNLDPATTEWNWPVQTNIDLGVSSVFTFTIWLAGQSSYNTVSHYINITNNAGTSSPSSSTTSTILPTSTSTSTSKPSISPPTSPAGLTPGAKAGIGIGVTAIFLLIASLIGWLIWSRRRKNLASSRLEGTSKTDRDVKELTQGGLYDPKAGPQEGEMHELSGDNGVPPTPVELPGSTEYTENMI